MSNAFFHRIVTNNTRTLYRKLVSQDVFGKILLSESNPQILDVGIGSGVAAKLLARLNPQASIEGLDVDDGRWAEHTDIAMTVYDGKLYPYKEDSFDVVILAFVLHHCENPSQVLAEATRVSRHSVIIIEELKKSRVQGFLLSLYDRLINLLIYGHFIQPPQFFREKELYALFQKVHLTVSSSLVISRRPLIHRVAYLLTKNT